MMVPVCRAAPGCGAREMIMGWLRTVVGEVYGLFVDDGSFAVAIVVWVGVMWVVVRRFGVSGGLGGVILFVGLGVILLESLWRFARRRTGSF